MCSDKDLYFLDEHKILRLQQVLSEIYHIDGGLSLPTLRITPREICKEISHRLAATEVKLNDVRLYGSAASVVLAGQNADYNPNDFSDIDLLFSVDFDVSRASTHFDTLLTVVMEGLKALFPPDLRDHAKCIPNNVLSSMYVSKLMKVPNHNVAVDCDSVWSLISLRNDYGKSIEIKFVKNLKRQFEFSVDSFQIFLSDSILSNDFNLEGKGPSVAACSLFGSIDEALGHLHRKEICITKPEEVRGGGLLKYCRLLVRGYKHPSCMTERNRTKLETLMCARFFIDFPTAMSQFNTLISWLHTHDFKSKAAVLRFLNILRNVITDYLPDDIEWCDTLEMLRQVYLGIEQAPEYALPATMACPSHDSNTRYIPLLGCKRIGRGRRIPHVIIATPSEPAGPPESPSAKGRHLVAPQLTQAPEPDVAIEGNAKSAQVDGSGEIKNDEPKYPSPPATPELKPLSHKEDPDQCICLSSTDDPTAESAPQKEINEHKADNESMEKLDNRNNVVHVLTPPSSEYGSSISGDSSSDGEDGEGESASKAIVSSAHPGPSAASMEEKEEVFSRCRNIIAAKDNSKELLAVFDLNVVDVNDLGYFGNEKSIGQTVLMVAAKHGRVQCVTSLLEVLNADVNMAGGLGQYTALHYAAYHGHADVVQVLLKHGADASLLTDQGETPEMAARVKRNEDIAEYLSAYRQGRPLPVLNSQNRGKVHTGSRRVRGGKEGKMVSMNIGRQSGRPQDRTFRPGTREKYPTRSGVQLTKRV